MERVSSDEEAYEEEEDAVDVATDLCVCALKRVLEPRHRCSVYLLYWYKSTSGRHTPVPLRRYFCTSKSK